MKKIFTAGAILLIACNATKQVQQPTTLPQNIVIAGKLYATVYQQKAAEYRALCIQAYNIARLRLDEALLQNPTKPAIVTDIDETILDNSPYQGHQAMQGKDYEAATWYQWTDKSAADTVPWAPWFLKYASSKGVEIFYITNREQREKTSTLINLQKFGLPNTDNDHLIPKENTSSKEVRRKQVAANHTILLLLGDNLADFSSLFDKKTMEERLQNANQAAGEFGKKFIVIPNPGYGDWESSLYKYNYSLTPMQKDSVMKATLKTY